MKATVLVRFQDKLTKEHYSVGQVINVADSARLEELVKSNVVRAEEDEAEYVAKPLKPTKKSKR
ncbi:MAG: hypothetical protein KBT03_06070 [Bacteroidales bacterium]|nr:hypothetical protein [Candidatus Scybalousia scybalohippi]